MLFNASRNLKEEVRNKHLQDNGVFIGKEDLNKSKVNKSISMEKPHKKNNLLEPEHDEPQQNPNNLAKLLFGTRGRGETLRKQRSSVDKTTLEQAISNRKLPSKSEERKQRKPPTVTVTNKNNTSVNEGSMVREKAESESIEKGPSSRLVPMRNSINRGAVAIPQRNTADVAANVRKNIIRTKIVNKMDDLLNKELVFPYLL